MRGKFLRILLVLVLVFGVMLGIQSTYTSKENTAPTSSIINTLEKDAVSISSILDKIEIIERMYGEGPESYLYRGEWIKMHFETPLYNGDVLEAIRLNLIPLFKALATGTVPDDKFIWEFEDAFLYFNSINNEYDENQLLNHLYCIQLKSLQDTPCGKDLIGVYDLDEICYQTEVRKTRDGNGNTIFSYAITGISVDGWCSPYGDICSREEALEYYDKCQERIQSIVSEVITARQTNGEPLTNEQRLKKIHDWLIVNADYAHEKLDLHKADREKYKFCHLWNEYGAIVDGEAVCKGYSYAFKAIVDELAKQTGVNIECEETENSTHSWIRVKLNGEWYNIDTTYDEGKTRSFDDIADDCFLVSDEAFAVLKNTDLS